MNGLVRALKGDAPYIVGEQFDAASGKVNYLVEGEKLCNRPLVVCLHGLNASLSQYSMLAKILSSLGHRVLRLDFPGHGLSDTWSRPPSDKDFLPALLTIIHQLIVHVEGAPPQPIDLIGFSLGGYVAVEFYNAFPKLVHKLVLLSPAGLIRVKPRSLRLLEQPVLSKLLRASVLSLYRLLAWLVVDSRSMTEFYQELQGGPCEDERIDANASNWTQISSRNLHSAMLYARKLQLWNNEDSFRILANHPHSQGPPPILFCWGDCDMTTPYRDFEEFLREQLPNAQWQVLQDCYHVILEEGGPQIYRRIFKFIQEDDESCTVTTTCDTPKQSVSSPSPPPATPNEEEEDTNHGAGEDGGAATTSISNVILPNQSSELETTPTTADSTPLEGANLPSRELSSISYVQKRIHELERKTARSAREIPMFRSFETPRGAQTSPRPPSPAYTEMNKMVSTSEALDNQLDDLFRRTTSNRETNYGMLHFMAPHKNR